MRRNSEVICQARTLNPGSSFEVSQTHSSASILSFAAERRSNEIPPVGRLHTRAAYICGATGAKEGYVAVEGHLAMDKLRDDEGGSVEEGGCPHAGRPEWRDRVQGPPHTLGMPSTIPSV